jgi:hypothetical protein
MGIKLRYGFVGAFAGVLVGVMVALPAVTMVYGRDTTRSAHRADMYLWAFVGAIIVGVAGFAVGWIRATRGDTSDDTA